MKIKLLIVKRISGYLFFFVLTIACVSLSVLPSPTPESTIGMIPFQVNNLTPKVSVTSVVPQPSPTIIVIPNVTSTPTQINEICFAVIGDYGSGTANEESVANLVKSWNPDFIITTGDNNYPSGSAATIDHQIGQFFHEFIYPYIGNYGDGATINRFFPTLGNHDWMSDFANPYFDYFTLPGNERYYDFFWGPIHLFAIDSDSNEPDGVGSSSKQADWLASALLTSTSAWNIVYMHQSPFSSGFHGSVLWARWPYKSWGADAIIGGHDHSYERLIVDDLPYFVNGLGGGDIYPFGEIEGGSEKRFTGEYGAMLITANAQLIFFQFFTINGRLIDEYRIER